ncbi:MAG TPA: hypothetical protein VII75_06050 [Thermoanaerobaculia bacterium]|nr:hypothetical protein [Thermoanaerobaculia bacterium]
MEKVSPLAVLAGAIIDFGTTLTFSFVIMICFVVTHRHQRLLDATHTTPVRTLQFVLGCGCSILGAYIAGVLAKRAEILNGLLATTLPELLSWLVSLGRPSHTPRIWLVLGVIAMPVMGLFGGWLAHLQARRSEAAA